MKTLIGEFLGTFLLVLIGCGTVAVAVLFEVLNLYGVALFFGMGVSIAIYASRTICPAHLNPAVSFAFFLRKELTLQSLVVFLTAQMLGAMIGGLVVFILFSPFIGEYEYTHGFIRGNADSYHSAVMFGEYFPNPGFEKELEVSHLMAIFWEALGTFILMLHILSVGKIEKIMRISAPILIGLTVTILIIFIAPFTQGGFNPARDFGPRIVAYFNGWGEAAFPSAPYSFFTVYILGPMLGSGLAVFLNKMLASK